MIRIMTSRFPTSTVASTPARGTTPGTGQMIHHSLPPSSNLCSFWFAIAMGGLLQGWPKEAVRVRQQRTMRFLPCYIPLLLLMYVAVGHILETSTLVYFFRSPDYKLRTRFELTYSGRRLLGMRTPRFSHLN